MGDEEFLEFTPPVQVASPCVNICRIDAASGLCLGCRRSRYEIARWSSVSDDERQAILDQLPRRNIGPA